MIEVNLNPYMLKIWDHTMDNWKEYPISSRTISTFIWENLKKEYGVRRIGYSGSNRNLATFPDEKSYAWFLLRWT
jgi:hypothetical protein